MTVVAVSGARGYRKGEADLAAGVVRSVISTMMGVTELRTGAQYGVDTTAAEVGLASHPKAKHVLVVPSAPHNEGIVGAFEAAREIRDVQIVRLPEEADAPKAYRARNLALLDGCELLAAFPSTREEVVRSGTWMTIRFARTKDMPLIVAPLDGSDAWVEGAGRQLVSRRG